MSSAYWNRKKKQLAGFICRIRLIRINPRLGKPCEGEIIAAGPGKLQEDGSRVALDVKAGDKVIFSKYAGTEVKYEGEKYLIVSERDILAIM